MSKKYYFLITAILCTSNLYSEITFLNCDASNTAKLWQKQKIEDIYKIFLIASTTNTFLDEGEIERGIYKLGEETGDLYKTDRKITYKQLQVLMNGRWAYIQRDTLKVLNDDGDIKGNCVIKTQEEWQKDVEEYKAKQTKGNVF